MYCYGPYDGAIYVNAILSIHPTPLCLHPPLSPPRCRHVLSLFSTIASLPLSLPKCGPGHKCNCRKCRAERKGKTQSFDFLARGLKGSTKKPENATRITRKGSSREKLPKVVQDSWKPPPSCTWPNTLGINCSVDQCPDPDWLQGGAQESQTQSALQKAGKN